MQMDVNSYLRDGFGQDGLPLKTQDELDEEDKIELQKADDRYETEVDK
ncbi:MAG: hypothetical protein WC389_08100 [Lutibacter sp.]|jgi:hypothetical protein